MTDSLDTVEFIEGQSGVYVLFFGGSAISEQQKIRIKWTLELERPPIIRDGREYIGVKCEVSTAWMVGDEETRQGWTELRFWWRATEQGYSDLWTVDWRYVMSLEVRGENFLEEMLGKWAADYAKSKAS